MDTTAIRDEWIGRAVDERFPLLAWLGGSEQSAVYLTEIENDRSQKAAIKLMQVDERDTDGCIAAWTAAKTLDHPHLLRLLHTGRCRIDGQPLVYVVTEYADEVLAEILRERPLTTGEAEEMLGPVLDALGFLHANGFVHGRLKPSNILVVGDSLKLASDGIQASGGRAQRLTEPSAYDAPELSTQAIAPAADLWSLGATLAETLTQRQPELDRSAPKDPELPASMPKPLAGLVRGCLRADPARRYTLDQVKACLQPGASPVAGDSEQIPARREVETRKIETRESKAEEPAKPRGRKFLGAAVLILGLAALAVFAIWSHRAKPSLPEESNQPPASANAAGSQPAPSAATPAPVPEPPASAASTASAPTAASTAASTPPASASSASTAKGAVADRVMPDIPAKATATIQGKVAVEIRVTVDAGGNVSDATIESDGHGRYFANLALQAVRQWKFTPPQADGQAVPSEWTLHFVFRQTGAEVTAVEGS